MIVVHIGLRKAGSTSIQAFLRNNETLLRAAGIDYPAVGRRLKSVNHTNLASEVRSLPKFEPAGGTIGELADHWRASDAGVMILSAEAFEECEPDEALKLAALKRDPHEEVRIVLVIRDLVSLMPSSYTQMVKLGVKTHDFDTFFEKRIRDRRNDYFETAKRWADAFGWASLRVRLLDNSQLLNGDLIDDFMSHADLDFAEDRASAFNRPDAANVGPGWRVVEAIRGLYSHRHGLPKEHPLGKARRLPRDERERIGRKATELGLIWGWNDDKGRYLTRAQARQCLEIYAASVKKLNNELVDKLAAAPLDLDARGFVERGQLLDIEHVPPRALRAFYDDLAAHAGLA